MSVYIPVYRVGRDLECVLASIKDLLLLWISSLLDKTLGQVALVGQSRKDPREDAFFDSRFDKDHVARFCSSDMEV